MNNDLLLLSKNDIPFTQARVNIHQPTLKEISFIGEESFHIGCQFLNFSIDKLSYEDKSHLSNKTDFEVFMSVMNSKEKAKYKVDALLVLTLLFPDFHIKIEIDKIVLEKEGVFTSSINQLNFDAFKDILASMFCLHETEQKEGNYNPADQYAAKIAEKLKKRQKTLAKEKGIDLQKVSIYSRYVSILSVGEQKDINELMEYTVYQLRTEFNRFQKKQEFDFYIQAKMAGAKDLEDVDNWMDEFHL